MNLYANLDLVREPFSNSPDPNFLHETRQHATCLQELEISLRLRRGLSVITGDIGTGKTTLCRSLLRTFGEDGEVDMHLLLDPHFSTPEEFLRVVLGSVSRLTPDPDLGLWELKEALKQQLFRLGMVERRLVVLIIDEGQKISPENLELLREMLNYETNSCKLLQIVIFAQRELEPMLAAMPNLADRINVRRRLRPLSLPETRQMVRHRLRVAAGADAAPQVGFSLAAICAIHLAGKGSPRKIVRLCHMALLEMLVRGRTRVGLREAWAAARPDAAPRPRRRSLALAAAAVLCLGLGSLWLATGPSGPVLGSAPGVFGAASQRSDGPRGLSMLPDAGPGAGPAAARQMFPAEAAPSDSGPSGIGSSGAGQPGAGGALAVARPGANSEPRSEPRPEPRSAALAAEGLTLQPEAQEAQGAPAGLTLLPQRDLGPTMRRPVAAQTPERLRVAAPEQGPLSTSDAGLTRVAAVSGPGAPGPGAAGPGTVGPASLQRAVALSMVGQ